MSRAWIKRYFFCEICKRKWVSKEYCATSIECKNCNKTLYEIEVEREYGGDGKLFGYFECVCGKWWESAYAHANSWQKCTDCNREVYPEWMEELQYSGEQNLNKPHRSDLCQRCLSGKSCVYKEPESRKPHTKTPDKPAKHSAKSKPRAKVFLQPKKTVVESQTVVGRQNSINLMTDYHVTYKKTYANAVKPKTTPISDAPESKLKPKIASDRKKLPEKRYKNMSDYDVSYHHKRQQSTESIYRRERQYKTMSDYDVSFQNIRQHRINQNTRRSDCPPATNDNDRGSLLAPILNGCVAVYTIYRIFK